MKLCLSQFYSRYRKKWIYKTIIARNKFTAYYYSKQFPSFDLMNLVMTKQLRSFSLMFKIYLLNSRTGRICGSSLHLPRAARARGRWWFTREANSLSTMLQPSQEREVMVGQLFTNAAIAAEPTKSKLLISKSLLTTHKRNFDTQSREYKIYKIAKTT